MSCQHGNWPPCDQCDELDAAYNRGYAEGGKISIDLTMKHLRRAESAESRLAEVRLATIDECQQICLDIRVPGDPYAPYLVQAAKLIRQLKEKS